MSQISITFYNKLSSKIFNFFKLENLFPTGLINQKIMSIEKLITKELSPTFFLASVFSSKLLDIPEITDFRVMEIEREFIVFLKEPNWDIEEKIYKAYSGFLEEVPDGPDLRVINLLDKTVDEVLEQL